MSLPVPHKDLRSIKHYHKKEKESCFNAECCCHTRSRQTDKIKIKSIVKMM